MAGFVLPPATTGPPHRRGAHCNSPLDRYGWGWTATPSIPAGPGVQPPAKHRAKRTETGLRTTIPRPPVWGYGGCNYQHVTGNMPLRPHTGPCDGFSWAGWANGGGFPISAHVWTGLAGMDEAERILPTVHRPGRGLRLIIPDLHNAEHGASQDRQFSNFIHIELVDRKSQGHAHCQTDDRGLTQREPPPLGVSVPG